MSTILRKYTIPFFVFITGACVLIIEVTAIRILAPYFGNTIFTVSSVISVVLAALSLGYYYVGKLADKYPKERLFYGIIAASGAAVIFLHLISIIFLYAFGYRLSIIRGPLISSFILFFLQNFLLGMLSPFAIKLQKIRLEEMGIGSVSGQIFSWSTLGSIFGTLLAGFFLIPHFGIDKIILGIGFLLIILGLFSSFEINNWFKLFLIVFTFSLTQFLLTNFEVKANNVIFTKDSLYQKITIYEGQYQGKPTRFLMQDRNSSAAEFLGSDELAYEYTKYYALYQIFNQSTQLVECSGPSIKQVLAIGGGAYSIPKALLKDSPDVHVDVAEIDPLVYELGKRYFDALSNPRLTNFAEDGRRFLHDTSKKYDLIFSDAYASLFSTPEHLTTQEFFKMAKEKLNGNGVLIANVVGSLSQKPQSFALSEMKTFKSVFDNSYFFAVTSPESSKPQNLIFVGYNGSSVIDLNSKNITGNKNYIISGLSQKIIKTGKFDFSHYATLTDNFAPVDYLISKEFNNIY